MSVITQPIFHRGAVNASLEENTLPAFREAARRGEGFEFDIHPSADETFVVIHDPTWDATTPFSGRVALTTQATIDKMYTDGGAYIPSMRNVLNVISLGASPVLIDMKVADPWSDDMIVRLGQLIDDFSARYKSFVFLNDAELISRIQLLAPDVRLSYRPIDAPLDPRGPQWYLDQGFKAVQPQFKYLTASLVDDYQAAGLKVISQDRGIETRSDLDTVRSLGVNYVLIDSKKWDKWAS